MGGNMKTNIREIGWEVVDWIHITQDVTSDGLLWTTNGTWDSRKGGEFLN